MDFGFKNYNLTSNQASKCEYCGDKLLNSRSCDLCKKMVCRNKCGVLLPPEFKKNKPYLIGFNYLCSGCINSINQSEQKNITASNDMIRNIFANIFSPDDDIVEETLDLANSSYQDDSPKADTEIKTTNINDLDNFIKVILNDLKFHNQLDLDINGELSTASFKKIVNSFQQLLSNALIT